MVGIEMVGADGANAEALGGAGGDLVGAIEDEIGDEVNGEVDEEVNDEVDDEVDNELLEVEDLDRRESKIQLINWVGSEAVSPSRSVFRESLVPSSVRTAIYSTSSSSPSASDSNSKIFALSSCF